MTQGMTMDSIDSQQKLLEVCYIRKHGVEVGSEEAQRLFPFGWSDYSSIQHIKALLEAIDKNILIQQTETWYREMAEGIYY